MADIRPKDLLPTAVIPAADDYLLLDGATAGTRKILATAIARASGYNACVDDFGAAGDGSTDDTTAIDAALAAADVVHFTAGKTYITDRIVVPGGKTLIGYGATLKLKAFDGAAANYKSVLDLVEVDNVKLYGLTIDGNRSGHTNTGSITGDEDSGMHGVDIMSGTGHVLVDLLVKNCFGDGLLFADGNYQHGSGTNDPATHVTVTRCVFDNNRRQGCSIVHGTDLVFNQCGFTNTHGTAPEYGVDIEPDPLQTHQLNKRIYFNQCWFTGNASKGFGMLIPGQTVEDVVLRDCLITGNGDEVADIWPNVNNGGTLRRFAIIGGYTDKPIRIGQSGTPASRTAIYEDCLVEGIELGPDGLVWVANTLGDGPSVTIRRVLAPAVASATQGVIRLQNCQGVLIEGCDLRGGARLIRVPTTMDRLIIRNNHLRGSSSELIQLMLTNDVQITGNYLFKTPSVSSPAINWVSGNGAFIEGNTTVGDTGNWLTVGASAHGLVLGSNQTGGRSRTINGTNATQYTIAAI